MFLTRRASAGFSATWRPFHQVLVTSRSSTAPTLVQHVSTEQSTYLSQGQTGNLRAGDQICLLCTNPNLTITVMSSKSTQQDARDDQSPDEPQRKRTKLEHPPPSGTEEKPLGSAAGQTDGAALKSIMLLLIGIPGSGKSTFSKSLIKDSALPWVHINQDTVGKNGKSGTRQMCLKQAKAALMEGKNCVMDRSNLTVEQRQDFVQLCQQLCSPIHALVLNLQPSECSVRVVDRTDHPTGVQGKNARGVVFRMNHEFVKAGSPQLSEGLSSIRICNTPEEVQETLDAWLAYGPSNPTPPPNFGLERTPWQPPPKAADSKGGKAGKGADAKSGKAADAKTVKGGGIMGLFGKQAAGAAKTGAAKVAAAEAATAKTGTEQTADAAATNVGTEQTAGAATAKTGTEQAAAAITSKTGTEQAAAIISKGGTEQAARIEAAGITAAATPSTAVADAGMTAAAAKKGNGKGAEKTGKDKNSTAAADAADDAAAAKAGNKKDAGKTGTAKSSTAAGKVKSTEKEKANAVKQTPSGSDHSPAPKPSQSMDDKPQPETPQGLKPPAGVAKPSGGGNAFAMMMKAAKATHTLTEASAAGGKSKGGSPAAARQLPGSLKAGAGSGGWQGALKDMALHPERHSSSIPDMYVDSKCVCIPDKYPKAHHHMLVVARDPELDSILDLKPQHLELLQHLKNTAQEQIDKIKASDPSASFHLGFHSVPSMSQLHLHVISTDFDSASLKNKKHWNSFTTPFFLHLDQVVHQLERDGAVKVDQGAAEALLKQELRCHRCKAVQKSIPALKAHIASCKATTA